MTTRSGRTGHIAWNQHGDDPRLVLLHGFTDAGMCWDPVIPGLGDVGVVTIDARGHGNSGLPEARYGAADQAADAASVIDDLGLREVIVMGHSMGGSTAVALASTRPELIKALILEDPAIRSGPSKRSSAIPDSFRELKAMSDRDRIQKCRTDNPAWSEEEIRPRCEAMARFNLDVYRLRTDDSRPTVETLRSLTMPVLLLHGDADRGSIVDEDVLATAGAHVRPVHIPGVGHSIRRENQAAFLDAVNGFLKEQLG